MTADEICSEISKLEAEFDLRLDAAAEDFDTAESQHHAQLLQGTRSVIDALEKFLSPSSKRSQGKLEFIFNLALQSIGGGSFSAEHGGHEQTNGKAMISLENFDAIIDVCILSLTNESDEEPSLVTKQLEHFKIAGASLYTLTKLMKQQGKLDPDVFIRAVAQFLIHLEVACPDCGYYNKIHFLASHVTEFVQEYHCYGLLSAEGHESHHARAAKAMAQLRNMGNNNDSKFEKKISREMALHNPDFVQKLAEVSKEGKKRGKYNKTKQKSVSESTIGNEADSEIVYKGKNFFQLPGNSGIIPHHCKDLTLYLIEGTTPPNWTNEKLAEMMNEFSCKRSINSKW
jgi:hypothetical protein